MWIGIMVKSASHGAVKKVGLAVCSLTLSHDRQNIYHRQKQW